MKRIASIIGAVALGTMVAAGSALGAEVQNSKVVVKGDKEVKIVTVIEDGKETVKAYIDGKEVDLKTLKGENVFYHGDAEGAKKAQALKECQEKCDSDCEVECEVICATTGDGACDAVSAKEVKILQSDGGLKIYVNGEEVDLDLSDIKKMLHEHAGELENHLSMIELDDLNIEKMMKGANMLVGEFAPKDGEFLVKKELATAPKVMIGITMDDISPALASHLKLDPKAVTMIQTVVKGQPGDMAGLQAFDIILAADGNHPMTSGHLFKVLQGKEPGDKLALKLLRSGEPMMAVVKLAPWNDKVMAKLSAAEEAEGEYEMKFAIPDLPDAKFPEQLSKELQQKLQQVMSEEHQIVIEKLHKQAAEHAEKAKELEKKIRVTAPKAMEWVEVESGKGEVKQLEKRLNSLEDRLDRIEKLLQKLVD